MSETFDDLFAIVPNTKAKADAWMHFGFKKNKTTSEIDKSVAVCKVCHAEVKYAGGTTNLLHHMRRKHPAISLTSEPVPLKKPKIKTEKDGNNNFAQPRLDHVITGNIKYPPKSVKALAITDKISRLIIKDLRPYSMVESSEFRDLVNTLDPRYIVPNRKTFSEVAIPNLYRECKADVTQKLSCAEMVALTTDGWTSRGTDSYITITACFIDGDWNLINNVLQTRAMPENHTAENIANVLKAAITEWNLPSPPVPPIVSDNAKNMVKAAELLETSFYLGCFAHTLNLAAQKALQVPSVNNLLTKVRKIVAFFHRSTIGATALKTQTDLLGLPNHKLIMDVVTRWNSAYDMFTRYLELQVAVTAVIRNKNLGTSTDKTLKDLRTLTDDDVSMAEEVVRCLRPLKSITTALCTESIPTISVILPLHDQLCNNFLQPKEEDTPCAKNVKKAVLNDLTNRYSKQQDDLAVASALDPRFKSLPFLSADEKENCFQNIINRMKNVNTVQVKVEPQNENCQSQLPPLPQMPESSGASQLSTSLTEAEEKESDEKLLSDKPTDTKSGFADFLGDVYITAVDKAPTPDEKARQEVEKYRHMPSVAVSSNPLVWWKENAKNFPVLSVIAKQYLCIPATSVPSERVFSTAGDIVTAQRASLKPKHVDMLIFLKKNLK
ncbi:E3 SUMO-protein ligase ZBED1-like [Saccostrea cucullata]|uniref:E3 SUMO-protein ligase ZBED1-like n=1 Tax=Saccostrea cuccullata TaxID=36930 RepID=UPI002ECFAE7E